MKNFEEIINNKNINIIMLGKDGGNCYVTFRFSKPITVVFSNGGGWDHVSASKANKTPTWEEMCQIKDLFFNEEETVIQYHPKKSKYKNIHNHCLHLWKKQNNEFELPPDYMI
jgi:hypothetical protein